MTARRAYLRTQAASRAKVAGLFALALAGGASIVYAPVATFAAAALVFVAGLWLILRQDRRTSEHPERATSQQAVGGRGTLADRLVPLYLLFWWAAMVAPLTTYTPLEVGSRSAEAAVSGSLQNQLLVASFGLMGMLFLPAAVRRVGRSFWWLMGLWGIYLCWGYASLLWSDAPAITVRNLVAFALVTAGSFALGAGFYGARTDGARLFFRHLVAAGVVSALAILIPLPLHLGEFNPFDPAQRLEIAGNFTAFASRPVMLAALTLVVASMVGLRVWRTRDWFGLLVLLLPIFVLKTRGPLLCAALVLAAVYLLYRSSPRDRAFQAGVALTGCFGAYLLYLEGTLVSLVPFLTRGNLELSLTLTGRLPLWDTLMPFVAERPLTGAGFAAFWNPENLFLMQRLVGFPVVSAHNGFLEELLNTGAVGLFLFLAFWGSAIAVSLVRASRGDPLGWMAFMFLVLYLLFNLTVSLMQEYLELPFMVVFALIGLMAAKPVREVRAARTVTDPARGRQPRVGVRQSGYPGFGGRASLPKREVRR